MDSLEKKIGYTFKNKQLLQTALSHSSYANEQKEPEYESYERLEFLGDSILGYVTADMLFCHEPPLPEGMMTKLRAELVCEGSLHKTALGLELGQHMLLGRGEEHTGGRERPSILADMVEAIIAAIYMDSGMDEAKQFIMDKVLRGAEINPAHRSADYKTRLQELVQRDSESRISYELVGESGPDHSKIFEFNVLINGTVSGAGSGHTKKEAEQMAAQMALETLSK